MLCRGLVARESSPPEPPEPLLLDRVRAAIAARHYSRRTEKAYVHWIKRYIFFHGKRHPSEMGAAEVTAFLTSLAVAGRVAAPTQNQALSALLFLYRHVLGVELPWLDDLVRAKRPERLPVVLSRDEVRDVLGRLDGAPRLMALLLYGAGLRLLECCRLRVKDVDFAANITSGDRGRQIHIFGAEGVSPMGRNEREDPTRHHVACAVEDLAEAEPELKARGIYYWIYESLVGNASKQVFFEDPCGNMVELQQQGTAHDAPVR